jgi:hypothetical protein
MPTDPIQRASAVAADYEALQGLTMLGAGVGLIIMALTATPAYGAAVVAMAVPLGQGYYYKKYGKVRQRPQQVWMSVASAVILIVVACSGIVADEALDAPVLLGPLAGAVGLLILGLLNYRHVGVTRSQAAVVGALAAGALLPLAGLVASDGRWRADVGLMGLALVAIGAVDHLRLTSAMRPVADG